MFCNFKRVVQKGNVNGALQFVTNNTSIWNTTSLTNLYKLWVWNIQKHHKLTMKRCYKAQKDKYIVLLF